MTKILNLLLIILIIPTIIYSKTTANDHIKKGNSLYNKQKHKDAEIEYRKALELEPGSNIAKYNLGNSLYRQGRFDEAMKMFDVVDRNKFNKKALGNSYHNLGNSYLQNKQYEQSIESYKKALINNPKDNDTKYNLEYARRMLQQQLQSQNQQQKQNQNNNKDNNQQQKQNQQQNDQKDNKDKQNQNSQNQQQNKDDRQDMQQTQQQQQKQNISKEDAERILQALMNKEKEMQKQMKKQNAVRGRLSKNW